MMRHALALALALAPALLPFGAFAAARDPAASSAAMTQPLLVSANGRFLVTAGGRPFFWMGDTAWRLHRLAPDDLADYLDTRKAQGFNVIQGPILTFDSPDYRGVRNDDPARPDERFFQHIDHIVAETERRGLYSALVVTWGHGFDAFGDAERARRYGEWLGRRYRARDNVVWIVAGEYAIDSWGEEAIATWRAIGEGLRDGSRGRHLITVHGNWRPPALQTSSTFYHAEPWLDFNMIQSSQGGDRGPGAANWTLIEADYRKPPPKPVIDGEATYERIVAGETPVWNGFGVRRRAYWSVFAGGFGHTYGADRVFYFEAGWREALFWDGGVSMRHLRALMESRPILGRIPDQDLIVSGADVPMEPDCAALARRASCGVPGRALATRDSAGRYAMVYIPGGERRIAVDTDRLAGRDLVAWWYDPADGAATRIGVFARGGHLEFTTPAGHDWVLVIDDAAAGHPAPGAALAAR